VLLGVVLGLAALTKSQALALAPLTAQAFTAENAIVACFDALGEEVEIGEMVFSVEDFGGGRRLRELEMFHLDARGATSDAIVARADCVVDSRARVRRIELLPLDAADADERALSAY
jgi:hypothetical protein